MRTFIELKNEVLAQRQQDNMNFVFETGREFQVSEKELKAYTGELRGTRLLGYELVTRTPVVPGHGEPSTVIVRRGDGSIEAQPNQYHKGNDNE